MRAGSLTRRKEWSVIQDWRMSAWGDSVQCSGDQEG